MKWSSHDSKTDLLNQIFRNRFFHIRAGSSRAPIVAVFLLLILSLFFIELPPWLLDILISINIVLGLTILLRTIFARSATSIFMFPMILVLATLFRLALNVSSTKLILLHGDQGLGAAGDVIQGFGSFVVGGDFIVGVIVFAIISVVNFVVIAKGSARVAEVAARFTLDALPGKQLAIDAEMRAGSLTKEEARSRRAQLVQESQFFGSMDGAMKWVQGDAIAGLIITVINAIGGVSLGLSRGMLFPDAISTFGILTIGEGLANIIPSLLVSVGAGILITNSGREKDTEASSEVVEQLFGDSRALLYSGSALLVLAGLGLTGAIEFPVLPFLIVGGLALVIRQFMLASPESVPFVALGGERRGGPREDDLRLLEFLPHSIAEERELLALPFYEESLDGCVLELDSRVLYPYLVLDGRGEVPGRRASRQLFEERLKKVRAELFSSYGLVLPKVVCAEAPLLAEGEYRIKVRGQEVRRGTLPITKVLVPAHGALLAVFGGRASKHERHPLGMQLCSWVDPEAISTLSLERVKLEIETPAEFLASSVAAGMLDVIEELVGLSETRKRIESLKEHHPVLVEEIFDRGVLTFSEIAELFRRLAREYVSIRDMKLILEAIAEYSAISPVTTEDRQEWIEGMYAHVRASLSRTIIDEISRSSETLRVFLLSEGIEEEFRSALASRDSLRAKPPLEPEFESSLRNVSQRMFSPVIDRGVGPVIVLCAPDVRAGVQDFFRATLAVSRGVRTIAFNEIPSSVRTESVGLLAVQY